MSEKLLQETLKCLVELGYGAVLEGHFLCNENTALSTYWLLYKQLLVESPQQFTNNPSSFTGRSLSLAGAGAEKLKSLASFAVGSLLARSHSGRVVPLEKTSDSDGSVPPVVDSITRACRHHLETFNTQLIEPFVRHKEEPLALDEITSLECFNELFELFFSEFPAEIPAADNITFRINYVLLKSLCIVLQSAKKNIDLLDQFFRMFKISKVCATLSSLCSRISNQLGNVEMTDFVSWTAALAKSLSQIECYGPVREAMGLDLSGIFSECWKLSLIMAASDDSMIRTHVAATMLNLIKSQAKFGVHMDIDIQELAWVLCGAVLKHVTYIDNLISTIGNTCGDSIRTTGEACECWIKTKMLLAPENYAISENLCEYCRAKLNATVRALDEFEDTLSLINDLNVLFEEDENENEFWMAICSSLLTRCILPHLLRTKRANRYSSITAHVCLGRLLNTLEDGFADLKVLVLLIKTAPFIPVHLLVHVYGSKKVITEYMDQNMKQANKFCHPDRECQFCEESEGWPPPVWFENNLRDSSKISQILNTLAAELLQENSHETNSARSTPISFKSYCSSVLKHLAHNPLRNNELREWTQEVNSVTKNLKREPRQILGFPLVVLSILQFVEGFAGFCSKYDYSGYNRALFSKLYLSVLKLCPTPGLIDLSFQQLKPTKPLTITMRLSSESRFFSNELSRDDIKRVVLECTGWSRSRILDIHTNSQASQDSIEVVFLRESADELEWFHELWNGFYRLHSLNAIELRATIRALSMLHSLYVAGSQATNLFRGYDLILVEKRDQISNFLFDEFLQCRNVLGDNTDGSSNGECTVAELISNCSEDSLQKLARHLIYVAPQHSARLNSMLQSLCGLNKLFRQMINIQTQMRSDVKNGFLDHNDSSRLRGSDIEKHYLMQAGEHEIAERSKFAQLTAGLRRNRNGRGPADSTSCILEYIGAILSFLNRLRDPDSAATFTSPCGDEHMTLVECINGSSSRLAAYKNGDPIVLTSGSGCVVDGEEEKASSNEPIRFVPVVVLETRLGTEQVVLTTTGGGEFYVCILHGSMIVVFDMDEENLDRGRVRYVWNLSEITLRMELSDDKEEPKMVLQIGLLENAWDKKTAKLLFDKIDNSRVFVLSLIRSWSRLNVDVQLNHIKKYFDKNKTNDAFDPA